MQPTSALDVTIEQLENHVWEQLRESLPRYGLSDTDNLATAIAQDISPKIADLLHSRGVNVDWSDRSRFGVPDRPRTDGKPRMTPAQRDKLWHLCAGYSVPFREDDYVLSAKQSGIGAGWVEGWVGGRDGSGITGRRTLFVGVSPSGESHS